LFRPAAEDRRAVFAQADWVVGKRLKLVAAGRIDDSNLFDARFSPRAAVVYNPTPLHTIRLTYGRAFEEPTIMEFFVGIDVAPPQDLSAFQTAFCDPSGVDCGFGTAQNPVPTSVLALGNEDLSLQQTETIELGYSGILGKRAHVTVDVYRGRNEDFVSSLLPQLGTPLGRVNENFGPWEPPSGLSDSSRDAIRQAVPLLSNGPDGSPVIAALSFTNLGNVDTLGAELGVRYYPDDHWALSMAFAWFDYKIEDPVPGTEDLLLPNTPGNAVSLGATYAADRWDVGLSGRWVDGFRWSSGVFIGDVESYTIVDLQANYSLGEHWRLGLNVANLLDNSHYEKFGGDLLRRRALASVAFDW
ncbi:MAG: TonB-dependent receptor, partial [Myxococcales bacterium]|nr:TonB-dependent receptor [Myxococcales bacterium]